MPGTAACARCGTSLGLATAVAIDVHPPRASSSAKWLRRALPIRAALDRERALRRFLDRLYRPPRSVLVPVEDEVIACRCEEVSVGQIRRAARLGAQGPNQLKAFTRCGMGPCQGRICGPIVSAVIAEARGVPIAEIGSYRPRAPYKPITVGAIAAIDADSTEQAC